MTKQKFKNLFRDGDDQDLFSNFGAISFHANQNQPEREQALSLFNRGVYPIIVATNVAARGLDIEGVTYVINYDLPMNLSVLEKYHEIDIPALNEEEIKQSPVQNRFEEYIQRIKWTGRADKEESILSFKLDTNHRLAESIGEMLVETDQNVPVWLERVADSEWSIRNARKKKNLRQQQVGSEVEGFLGFNSKEWDDSNGPCVDELWGNGELAAASTIGNFRLSEAGVIGSAQSNVTQNFEFVEVAVQKESRLKEILLDIHSWNELTFLNCNCWKKERNGYNSATGSDQPNIKHFLLHVLGKCAKEKILIFVETKKEAHKIADSISEHLYRNFRGRFMTKKNFKLLYNDGDDQDLIENFGAISFHADKDQYNRETALSLFNEGVYPILVAANVAAREPDIKGVTYVINYHLNVLENYQTISTQVLKDVEVKQGLVRNQFEEYIRRIGRAGKKGHSISFFQLDKDRHLAEPIRDMLGDAQQNVPKWLERIADSEFSIRNAREKERKKRVKEVREMREKEKNERDQHERDSLINRPILMDPTFMYYGMGKWNLAR
ncbi:uncharacterized protein LOC134819536 [Bolinopsis microptera]|uniref:uncharacterized protein LOC134819536 n=1 Tax=Bolinopsis microptera TaxID=2820187 RepID=UPI00307B0385